jgi:glycosyltransferase involved in cell wall biosynthesis
MKVLLARLGVGTLGRRLLGVRLGRFHQYAPRPLSIGRLADPLPGEQGLPPITMVTPSFNQARFVGQTVESVLAQHYPGLQYIVQDAQSADGTAQVLAPFADRGVDVRIEADAGQADALNRGFARARGEVMAYLNSDDLLLPGTLLLVGRYFRDHPEADVVYGNRLVVDETGREVGRWILPGHAPEVARFIDYIPQESLFWRRRVWEKAGARFDTGLQFALDWDLILRFMDAGAIVRHLPGLFGVFRTHGDQKTRSQFASTGAREMERVRSRYGDGGIGPLRRLRLHWQFLSRHREADRQWGYAT